MAGIIEPQAGNALFLRPASNSCRLRARHLRFEPAKPDETRLVFGGSPLPQVGDAPTGRRNAYVQELRTHVGHPMKSHPAS